MVNISQQKFSELFNDLLKTKGVSENKLAEMSGVPLRFLNALGNENYNRLPPATYIRGYLFKIAEVLNIDGSELWENFRQENENIKKSGADDKLPSNRFEIKKINQKMILAGTIIAILGVYLIFRSDDLTGRPSIYLTAPLIDEIVAAPLIIVKGSVKSTDTLKINDENVYVDSNGDFQKEIIVQPGINNLQFKLKKFLGKEIIINRRVIYNYNEIR